MFARLSQIKTYHNRLTCIYSDCCWVHDIFEHFHLQLQTNSWDSCEHHLIFKNIVIREGSLVQNYKIGDILDCCKSIPRKRTTRATRPDTWCYVGDNNDHSIGSNTIFTVSNVYFTIPVFLPNRFWDYQVETNESTINLRHIFWVFHFYVVKYRL